MGFNGIGKTMQLNECPLNVINKTIKNTLQSHNSEVGCNNCLKKYTGETGGKLKERMKEHKDDG